MTNVSGYRDGVVGLTVLLIASVVMTVGLAVATQSISQTRQSRQEEESEQALNLAEEGLEDALSRTDLNSLVGGGSFYSTSGNARIEVTASDVIDNAYVRSGHTLDVLLQAGSTNLEVEWDYVDCSSAAIVVSVIDSNNNLARSAFDSCATRRPNNSFSSTSSDGVADAISNPSGTLTYMRIKPLYSDAYITVRGTDLPDQSYLVTSSATLDDGTTRTVQVRRSLPMLPSIFDYVLFSGTAISY